MTEQPRRFGLSKSKITMFEQCAKRLWFSVHRSELALVVDGTEARFATGHEVGAVACALLPDGVMVEAEPDLAAALSTTKALLEAGHDLPIFEATLEHDGVLVRIDVLEPDGKGGWRLAEVKSSTKPKDYHIGDLATQLWVARNAGLQISSAVIRHIDTSFVLETAGDYAGLLADTDVLATVEPIALCRAEVVTAARETLAGAEPPIDPGDHCHKPFSCEFSGHCHKVLPAGPEWPVTILPNGGGKRWLERGVPNLLEVEPSELSNAVHLRVYKATASGEHFHDPTSACDAMSGWAYPRTWLDFETIAFAIPRWIGTRPYQQIPFQFSAHVEQADGPIDHHEFLSIDGADPRRGCAEALVNLVPACGAVIGYNASFEKSRILELADCFPDIADQLRGIAARVVDLLPVTRASWYHRNQRGSWSIKSVLPTIDAELDYATLEVKDGGAAQAAYLEGISPACCDDRRRALADALKIYCGRDTWAMIALARTLAGGGDNPASSSPIGVH